MQKGREHHAVHATVWQRHLNLRTTGYCGNRRRGVGQEPEDYHEKGVCGRTIVWMCECFSELWIQRALQDSPFYWRHSDHAPTNIEAHVSSYGTLVNLSYHRRRKASIKLHTIWQNKNFTTKVQPMMGDSDSHGRPIWDHTWPLSCSSS